MFDAIVIGVGGMGSAALHHLARRGAKVLGIEQFDIPHDRGSSHGTSRIIRLAYWEDPKYVPLLRRAYVLWRELEQAVNERLLFITGMIDAGREDSRQVRGVLQACADFDLPFETFDSESLAKRFPGYRLPHDVLAVHQPDGGFLLSERCIEAHVRIARESGAVVHTRERVLRWETGPNGVRVETDRGSYDARHVVFTAGAWTGKLLKGLSLTPERQVMLWTRPHRPDLFRPDVFPVFYIHVEEGAYYGFPAHDELGFKIGRYHHLQERVDPDAMDRDVHARDEEILRSAITRYFPLAGGPTVRMKTCLFTNTPDEHFAIGTLLENVTVAAGFSGHGYKFCSVVGEILADLALHGGTEHDISLFRLERISAG